MKNFRWPDGVRCAVFVSINFDAESFDLKHTSEDRLFGRFSYGRYGVRAGLPRLLGLLERRRIRATWFVTGVDALRHRAALRDIHAAGHELGCRAWELAPVSTLGEEERGVLAKSRDLLAEIAGAPPAGFRAPGGELGSQTLKLLAELGFRYDSSFQDDDHPYVIAPTATTRIAEIPTVWSLDDSLAMSARHTHARLMKTWGEEFEALEREGCLVPFTIHLRGDVGLTRAARIAALDELLQYVGSRPGVKFMTGAELADHVLASGAAAEANPFDAHQETLALTPYRGELSVKPL